MKNEATFITDDGKTTTGGALNMPPSIVETKISKPPKKYEGYLYRFTNLKNGMIYLGVHKGFVEDHYWQSSTDKDFVKIFSDSSSELLYEILDYGTYDEMTVKEHKILKMVDAKNNPLYYNKSNGSPRQPFADLEKCKGLVARIENGEFDVGKEPINELTGLERLQVRTEDIGKHQTEIKQKIDDAGGNTDKCRPILLFEGLAEGGSDLIVNGNHTLGGADMSKHAVDVPVARVPKKVHKDYSDEEIKGIGNLLNRREDIVKEYTTNEDAVKWVVGRAAKGVDVNSESNTEWLKEYGHTRQRISTILKKAEQEVEEGKLAQGNLIFVKYDAEPHKSRMENKVEQFRTADTMCFSMSSGLFDWRKIINKLFDNADYNQKTRQYDIVKPNVIIVVHHPSIAWEEDWKRNNQPAQIARINHFLKPLGYNVRFVEMETTMPNGSI
tara:strand:+ start:292 stop:1614 length:1323 start_codon:yes stop_codon:yes gene_type:complete